MATAKCAGAYFLHALGDNDVLNTGKSKQARAYLFQPCRKHDLTKTLCLPKCLILNLGNVIGNVKSYDAGKSKSP